MKLQVPEQRTGQTIRYEALDQLKLKEEEEKQDSNAHKVTEFNLKTLQQLPKLYRLDKIVAHGTFGIVYRANRSNTNEIVAIKRVFQDSRYKNRELDMLKLVCKYTAQEDRMNDS